MSGNVFLKGAQPCKHDQAPLVQTDFDPNLKLNKGEPGVTFQITLEKGWGTQPQHQLVTSELLGKAKLSELPYVHPDDSPLRIDRDYLGKNRDVNNPYPGPFELPEGGQQVLKVWPPQGTVD
jgi:alpha-N-arabinofuranosidase